MSGGRVSAWPRGRQDHRSVRATGRAIGDLCVAHHGRDCIAGSGDLLHHLHGDEVGTLCIVGEFEARSSTESPIGDRSSRQKWIYCPARGHGPLGHGSANGLDKKDWIAALFAEHLTACGAHLLQPL